MFRSEIKKISYLKIVSFKNINSVLYIYSRPKVTLHFSYLNISILVLILSKWNIAISFQHFSTHNS